MVTEFLMVDVLPQAIAVRYQLDGSFIVTDAFHSHQPALNDEQYQQVHQAVADHISERLAAIRPERQMKIAAGDWSGAQPLTVFFDDHGEIYHAATGRGKTLALNPDLLDELEMLVHSHGQFDH